MAEITTEQWQVELDRLLEATAPRVVASGGFTRFDIQARRGAGEKAAREWLCARMADGSIRCIGVRPGRGGARVYEVVK